MSDVADAVIQDLAPTGIIRAAINTCNPVLARKAPDGGEPPGASAEIGRRIGRPVQLIAYETAGSVVNALAPGESDVASLAQEPARADRVVFSAPMSSSRAPIWFGPTPPSPAPPNSTRRAFASRSG